MILLSGLCAMVKWIDSCAHCHVISCYNPCPSCLDIYQEREGILSPIILMMTCRQVRFHCNSGVTVFLPMRVKSVILISFFKYRYKLPWSFLHFEHCSKQSLDSIRRIPCPTKEPNTMKDLNNEEGLPTCRCRVNSINVPYAIASSRDLIL